MNPVGYITSALGITVLVHQLDTFRPRTANPSGLAWVLLAVGPYVTFVILGCLTHLLVKLWRGHERISSTLAMVLFAGGTVVILIELCFEAGAFAYHRGTGLELPRFRQVAAWVLTAAITIFLVSSAVALATIHKIRWWKAASAVVVAFAVMGLVMSLSLDHLRFAIGLFVAWLRKDAAGDWHLIWRPGWLHGA